MAGWNRPARHIGGDYYDFFPFAGGRSWGLVLGDVSGKGVPAALLVSTLHSALRLLLDRLELGSDLFFRLNEHILASSAANKFITLLAARLETSTGELHYLNAGHNPGIIVRARGGVEQMGPGGLPLGLLPGVSCRTEVTTVEKGDLLCLYSDGITEAVGPDDVEFGFDRLAQPARRRLRGAARASSCGASTARSAPTPADSRRATTRPCCCCAARRPAMPP